ncbi:hypothetical protein WN51_13156 [Melipona quadrifasciata]|uniref:Uncharacterized protein n=1 Tax=Melipona quadrifasciata TaxID=166423 RepID=A0A0N0U5C6_9HYME|nr:hypothetical protein WN51_13156 [Melipona quadrifasciata]
MDQSGLSAYSIARAIFANAFRRLHIRYVKNYCDTSVIEVYELKCWKRYKSLEKAIRQLAKNAVDKISYKSTLDEKVKCPTLDLSLKQIVR